jgi:hypothetical protein
MPRPDRSISGVHVAIRDEQIEPTVVVEIGKSGSPAERRERPRSNTGLMADVAEDAFGAVLIQRVVVLGEIRDEHVQPTTFGPNAVTYAC